MTPAQKIKKKMKKLCIEVVKYETKYGKPNRKLRRQLSALDEKLGGIMKDPWWSTPPGSWWTLPLDMHDNE